MNNTSFNPAILQALDIKLNDEQQATLLDHLQKTLEERVGLAIFDLLDDDQATELLQLQEQGDSKAVSEWATRQMPDLQDIVQDEYDILLGELADHAEHI